MPPSKRSGNPAKRAAANGGPDHDKYSPNVWLSGALGGTEDLLLPSGQLVLVRRPGVQGLVESGVLKHMDSLTALVNEQHIKRVEGKSGPEKHVDMDGLMKDEEKMAEITHVIDKVVCYCVLRPEVHRTPDDVTRRVPGTIYADMIDIMDKTFVFQFVVGGTRDLESFRGQLGQLLGGVASEPDVQPPAE